MSKRLVNYCPYTQTSTWHYYDHSTDTTYVEEVQDCQNIIDKNGIAFCERFLLQADATRGKKSDHFHFATIPNSVIAKFKKDLNLDIFNRDDMKKIERLIQRDPDYRYLRTY